MVGPKNITGFLGDRVELQCQVTGIPKPKVQWFSKRDGKLSSNGPNFRIHRNNSLIFRRIDKRDETLYHCVAENSQGNVNSQSASVTVEGKLSFFLEVFINLIEKILNKFMMKGAIE